MTREHYDRLLAELDEKILEMGTRVAETIVLAVDTLERGDVVEAKRLIEADNEIDHRRYQIEQQTLLLIATQQPLARDLRTITAILTVATELERMADYCEGIAKLTLRTVGEPVSMGVTNDGGYSRGQASENLDHPGRGAAIEIGQIRQMAEITQRLLREVLGAYENRDVPQAGAVWVQDNDVDRLYEEIFRGLLREMVEDHNAVRRNTYLLWVAHNLERIADRVTNIAERVAFVVTGDVEAFRDQVDARTLP